MTGRISSNCHRRVIAQAQIPGITLELEDAWLDGSPSSGVYSSSSKHTLSLLQVDLRSLRPRTGFEDSDYVRPRSLLMYDPPDVRRHTYTLDGVPSSDWPVRNRALCCYFDPVLFHEYTGLGGDLSPSHLKACLALDRPLLLHSMEELFREMASPGFANDLFIDCMGRLLMVELARHFKSWKAVREPNVTRLATRHLDRIYDHVNAASGHKVSLQELANLCGLSIDHLRQAFKNSTGQSLGAYVEQVRITQAKTLLAQNRLTLKQIAHQVGFASPSSFSVAFHAATGETPKVYRLRNSIVVHPTSSPPPSPQS